MREESQITDAVQKVAESEDPLYQRFEGDLSLTVGEPYVAGKGYSSYTDNRPQTLSDVVSSGLAMADLTITIPIDKQVKKTRRVQSEHERFAHGALDQVDYNRFLRGEPPLQAGMSWYAVHRGWLCALPLVYKSEEAGEKTIIEIDLWDRRWVRYQMGRRGFKWVAYERILTGKEAIQEYDVDIDPESHEVKVIDFWDDEINALLIDDKFYKYPTPHQIGYCPVIVYACGTMPPITSTQVKDVFKYRGESIIARNRHLYPANNKVKSALLTMVERGMRGNYKVYSSGGQLVLQEDPGLMASALSLDTDRKEEVSPLETLTLPQDTGALMASLDSRISEGGAVPFGPSAVSGTPSGLALQILEYPYGLTLDMPKMAMERVYEEVVYSLTRQFSSESNQTNLGLEDIELRVPERKGFKLEKFKPSEIKPQRFSANLEVDLPKDEMERWYTARFASEIGMSTQWIMEEILKVLDPDLEMDKRDEEFARQHPLIRLLITRMAMEERDSPDMLKDAIEIELMKMSIQQKQELGSLMQSQQKQIPEQPATGVAPKSIPAPQANEAQRLSQMGLAGPRGM